MRSQSGLRLLNLPRSLLGLPWGSPDSLGEVSGSSGTICPRANPAAFDSRKDDVEKDSYWNKLFLIQLCTSLRSEYGTSLQFGWVIPLLLPAGLSKS
jgi:hypothetical protein